MAFASCENFVMIDVLLDTTSLRSDPTRRSSAWKMLKRLATDGKLRIHISDISRREFITHREQEFNEQIANATKCIAKLSEICPNELKCNELTQTLEDIEIRRNQVSTSACIV